MKIICKLYNFKLKPTLEQIVFLTKHFGSNLNVSKNILKQGINILSDYGTESDIKQKQEVGSPLGESVILASQLFSSWVVQNI